MVKRYNPHSSIDVSAWIVEDAGGSVVLASDYDALAAELRASIRMGECTADKLADMTADYHRWHQAYCDAKYPESVPLSWQQTAAALKVAESRIAALEAALTNFLVWNGTDYTDDEAREYALVGICEEAYTLLPVAASTVECGMCHGTGVTTLITVHSNGNTHQQVPCDCTSKADAGTGAVGHTGPPALEIK
jgi:hypothetical protein